MVWLLVLCFECVAEKLLAISMTCLIAWPQLSHCDQQSKHVCRAPTFLSCLALDPKWLHLLSCLQHLVGCMAKVLDSRDSTSPEVAAAGMVINTMGYIDGLGYELLADAVMQLRVCVCLLPGSRPFSPLSGLCFWPQCI